MNFNKLIMKVYKTAIRDIFHAYNKTNIPPEAKKVISVLWQSQIPTLPTPMKPYSTNISNKDEKKPPKSQLAFV